MTLRRRSLGPSHSRTSEGPGNLPCNSTWLQERAAGDRTANITGAHRHAAVRVGPDWQRFLHLPGLLHCRSFPLSPCFPVLSIREGASQAGERKSSSAGRSAQKLNGKRTGINRRLKPAFNTHTQLYDFKHIILGSSFGLTWRCTYRPLSPDLLGSHSNHPIGNVYSDARRAAKCARRCHIDAYLRNVAHWKTADTSRKKRTSPAMSDDRTTVVVAAACPNVVLSEWKRGQTENASATDLLVFLLQGTIVPLVYGNPGSTLGWIHCDKFLQLLLLKNTQDWLLPVR